MANKQFVIPTESVPGSGGGGGGVSSFTGDGVVLSNSASTGAVTATLENFTHNTFLAGPASILGFPAAPTDRALVTADLPIANAVGSAAFSNEGDANSTVTTVTGIQVNNVTINRGDCVVVFAQQANSTVFLGSSIWQCFDNGGNSYAQLASATTGGVGVAMVFVCLNAAHAANLITAKVGSASASPMEVIAATYTGVSGLGATIVTSTALGATTNGTIAITPTQANSIMAAGFFWYKSGSAISVAANTGNVRGSATSQTSAVGCGYALVDNTQAGLGSETCAVTASAAPTGWAIIAIELIHN